MPGGAGAGRWQVSVLVPKVSSILRPQIQLLVELLWPLFLFFILVAVRHSHPPLEHHECESRWVWWEGASLEPSRAGGGEASPFHRLIPEVRATPSPPPSRRPLSK